MSEPYWVPLGATGGVLDTAGYGTSLPGSPVDGQEYILVDNNSNPTYSWRFRYVAAKTTNKWVFLGGVPIDVTVETEEATTSVTYVALATAGPSIVVPVAGVYDVIVQQHSRGSGASIGGIMSYDIGGTAASDVDSAGGTSGATAANQWTDVAMTRRKTLTAVTLTAKYRVNVAGTANFSRRTLSLRPVAVGG